MTTNSERIRKCRERRRNGTLLVRIEVGGETRDVLADEGLLGEWDTENPSAVAEAIERVLRLLPRLLDTK